MPRNSFEDRWKKQEKRFNFVDRIAKIFILIVVILIVVSTIIYIWGYYQVLMNPEMIGEWFGSVLDGFQGDDD